MDVLDTFLVTIVVALPGALFTFAYERETQIVRAAVSDRILRLTTALIVLAHDRRSAPINPARPGFTSLERLVSRSCRDANSPGPPSWVHAEVDDSSPSSFVTRPSRPGPGIGAWPSR